MLKQSRLLVSGNGRISPYGGMENYDRISSEPDMT